jgi:hypothetical protein
MRLLFYKAEYGTWRDKLIAFWTHGVFSHCELQMKEHVFGTWEPCFSASWRDNGVRFKNIVFDPGKWVAMDYLHTAWNQRIRINDWALEEVGSPYDVWAMVGFTFHQPWQDSDAWYCSELVSAALRVGDVFRFPRQLSPQRMYDIARARCDCFGKPYDPATGH